MLFNSIHTILSRSGIRLIVAVCITAITTTSCLPSSSKDSTRDSTHKNNVLNIFITGSELGELKPCGCSGGQLGGLDRRAAILNTANHKNRLIIDTGSLVEGDGPQDLIKFGITIDAFRILGYDMINLNDRDIAIAQQLGLVDDIGKSFNAITPGNPTEKNLPEKFKTGFILAGRPLNVTIISFDTDLKSVENISKLFPPPANNYALNILILNKFDAETIHNISQNILVVDCIICPADSDEPRLISSPNDSPLVFSVGRFGRYVSKIQVQPLIEEPSTDSNSVTQELAEQNETVTTDKKLKLRYTSIAVSEDLPLNNSLVELYKYYQQLVRESRLLETYFRLPLPDNLQYVGSKACQECHSYEYEMWSSKPHADAFAILERVGSQFDPECVICHVIGMDYESGFIWPGKTDYLKNVGCENCHGPGSEHIRTSGKVWTTEPQFTCTDCHTPEHSAEYAGNEELYMEKIVHWMEPNASSTVEIKGDSGDL